MTEKVVHSVSSQPRRRVFRSGRQTATNTPTAAKSEQLIHERLKALGYVE